MNALVAESMPPRSAAANALSVVIAIWITGAVLIWGLAAWRIRQFQRCLRFGSPASADVQLSLASLAEDLGLRRYPAICQVPGRISPLLWTFPRPVRIVVPSELWRGLDRSAQQTLLLHELIHYRRGDHWVRWLELLTLGLYWWCPIVWLIHREIRAAEELACDASVVAQRPDDRRAYAEMLVSTIAFVSEPARPAFATGVIGNRSIEARLRNVLCAAGDVRLTLRTKVLACGIALGLLPLAPVLTHAQNGGTASSAPAGNGQNAASAPPNTVAGDDKSAKRIDGAAKGRDDGRWADSEPA